jgi:hypothetical protein
LALITGGDENGDNFFGAYCPAGANGDNDGVGAVYAVTVSVILT